MMTLSLDFAPLTAWWLLALVCLPAVALIAGRSSRAPAARCCAPARPLALALAIANPVINEEERAPLTTVVPVIVDRSQSQNSTAAPRPPTRRWKPEGTARPLPAIRGARGRGRHVEGGGAQTETRLFEALNTAIRDVPPSRLGGAVMITDGQVHDAPAGETGLPAGVPLHVLNRQRPTSSTARSSSPRRRASRSPASPSP
jgi:hypothetical protein